MSSRAAQRVANLLLIVPLTFCGCGEEPPRRPKAAATPASPREALIQLTEATHEGDEAKLFAALEATEQQRDLFRVLTKFIATATDFRDTFIQTYGEPAWQDFQDDDKAPQEGNATLTISDSQEKLAQIEKLEFDERGDEAFCESLDEPGKKVRFIKVADGWRVDAGSICPPEEELQQAINQFQPMVEIIAKYKKAIGQPGIQPEDIDAEMGRELTKLLTGFESPAPHRFEIDKL